MANNCELWLRLGIAFKSIKSLNHYKKQIAFSKKGKNNILLAVNFNI